MALIGEHLEEALHLALPGLLFLVLEQGVVLVGVASPFQSFEADNHIEVAVVAVAEAVVEASIVVVALVAVGVVLVAVDMAVEDMAVAVEDMVAVVVVHRMD